VATDTQRRRLIVTAMKSVGIDVLACFSPTDVLLLSGYWPVMGKSIAFLKCDGTLAVVLPEDEVELAEATSDAHLIPYKPDTLKDLRPLSESLKKPGQELASHIKLDSGAIGTSLSDNSVGVSYQSVNRFRLMIGDFLEEAYPSAELFPADNLLERLRATRTPIEMEQLRVACRRARVGFDTAQKVIQAGMSENEIAAEIEAAFNRSVNGEFERSYGYFFCMSGLNSVKAAGAYARTRNRNLENGDFVMIHANTVGDGAWTDITRTYIVGTPSERQTRMMDAVQEARDAALKAIAPGVKASEVDAAARQILAERGFGSEFLHAVGHGVGFAAADANAMPRLHPKSPDVLEAGMTFNIEPAIYVEGLGGTRHCDVVACTGIGAEVLTSF
jgi:Xaa-Pro aminopeptidase